MTALQEQISQLIEALPVTPPPDLLEKLQLFRKELLVANRRINLISRKNQEQVADRLISDSLALLTLVEYRPDATLLDLGSGAGFPGIVHKLVYPDLRVISVESNRRKIEWQRTIARRLDLSGIQFLPQRLEKVTPQQVDYVVAKAVGSVETLCRLAEPHLLSGGLLILPRSQAESPPDSAKLGNNWEIVLNTEYETAEPDKTAKLLVLRKVGN
ncbi:MAG: 16S rRNA (guanine(527)-N(7))-methyltransferase RsmG [candidate division Zixibacteria bacterium]|nr:16S rRNA (guanine(527)-N(7))-methyltransferase RsmG [candidate division Zixibacteria bacterium]